HDLLHPAAEELLGTVAEDRLDSLREKGVAPRRVRLPQVLARGLRHVAEALLALGERRLGALVVLDVAHRARSARGSPLAAALGDPAGRAHPAPAADLGAHAAVDLADGLLAFQPRDELLAHGGPVVGMDQLVHVGAAHHSRDRTAAKQAGPARPEIDRVRFEVEIPFGEVGGADRELQPLLRLGERALGAPLLGDVAPHAAVAEETAFGVLAALARDDVDLARAALVDPRHL